MQKTLTITTLGILILICSSLISASAQVDTIPDWIKNNSDWWSKGLISDREFVSGLGYMVKENIIRVENIEIDSEGTIIISNDLVIPQWIHNNARWWADGTITDDDFKSGIQYMFKENIIQISSQAKSHPNIIVIMVDDLELGTLDAMLENNLMPNLQEFVIDKGTEFTNSFVTTPICCPSRSTFLTGQYSHNHGVLQNRDTLNLDDSHTLATWLHDSGYRTGLVGKYLNGYGTKIPPTYVPAGWDSWTAIVEPGVNHVYNYTVNDNRILVNYGVSPEDYKTDVLAKYATDFINESEIIDDATPFFLEITPTVPHPDSNSESCYLNEKRDFYLVKGPVRYEGTVNNVQVDRSPSFNNTKIFSDKFLAEFTILPINDKTVACLDQIYQNRMEAMRAVDDLIRVVINTLDMNNEFDNTVIMFTSDNGFLFGEHGLIGKELVFEESIRVPLFISTPEHHKLQSSSKLVINNDLAPTILELAGATADISMDGRSLIPLLSNPNQEDWRDKFLIEYVTDQPDSYLAIRTNTHVYVSCITESFLWPCYQFYDLILDPYQLNNLYPCMDSICADQITALDKLLLELKDCREGTCQTIEDKK